MARTKFSLKALDLSPAFTADTREGMFFSKKSVSESMPFKKFGKVSVKQKTKNGKFKLVPFFIADPAKNPKGLNAIVLKGTFVFVDPPALPASINHLFQD